MRIKESKEMTLEYLQEIKDRYYGSVEEKPETEQRLFALQDKYYQEKIKYNEQLKKWEKQAEKAAAVGKPFPPKPKDTYTQYWSQMLEIVCAYARSALLQRCKVRYMEPDQVTDKANEAAIRFMSQYIRRPDFAVGASFDGMFSPKIMEVLYGKTEIEEENHVSLNAIIGDSNSELGDLYASAHIENFMCMSDYKDPSDVGEEHTLKTVIDDILKELRPVVTSRQYFLSELYLAILLQQPRNRHIKRLFISKYCKDFSEEKLLDLLGLETYNRLQQIYA